MVGHTIVLNPDLSKPIEGRVADVMCAAYLSLEAALRLIKPGTKIVELTNVLSKMCTAYRCTLLDIHLSSTMTRNDISGKVIPHKLKPGQTVSTSTDDSIIEAGEVWCLSAVVSSGEGKLKDADVSKPTIYQRNMAQSYNLKLKASRNVLNEITKRFGAFPFSLRYVFPKNLFGLIFRRALEDKRAHLGILECVQHNLLHVHPLQYETASKKDVIASFKATILVSPNGVVTRITHGPPVSYVKSVYGVAGDRELGAVLEKIRPEKKKDAMDLS
jgi:methionine aminopeptidase